MKHLFFLIIGIFALLNSKTTYDYLLEWGLNNSLIISDKLGMRYINQNNKTYYAKDEIPEHTIIMDIPFEIMLNIDNALDLLNSKKLNKLNAEYKKAQFDVSVGFLPASQDLSFLSYLIYLVNLQPLQLLQHRILEFFHQLIRNQIAKIDDICLFEVVHI